MVPEAGRKSDKSTAPVKTIKKPGVVLPIRNTPVGYKESNLSSSNR